ncbi:glycosyltransferase family 1 protein [Bacillus velezensis]|uniref:glycosyltransferase family 4 protein n=1 Tax=Bacillus TaxID=1386 RepID=UPI00038741FC|nr:MULTISPECIES: glycosyltransferase family 4 protein [Bacillus]AWG40174.1 glycosyltransferase family 1 protein [Bacillus velezensis]MBC2598361.1 glycosyltransferase family 4 protein [Bacillus velezensis]MBU5238521.1 glycosyltransferase family 4 protein [Bacillus velezensis]MCG0589143.1 glycosyltransferase family 4 protein [Bacillus velezensis]MED4702510.1 glycosyltransferase family 4 protein [Bacillus velezensis]
MIKTFSVPYPYMVQTLDRYYGVKTRPRKKAAVKTQLKHEHHIPRLYRKKKKLSILIATFWDYPHTGGLSNYIKTLSEGLKKRGHKVDVISPNLFPSVQVKELRAAVVPKLKDFFKDRYGVYNDHILKNNRLMFIYEQMLQKIHLERYDVFHAQDLFTANMLGRFNQIYKKPLFFTPHGMFTFNRLKFHIFKKGSVEEIYYKKLEMKAIEYADRLIIISDTFRSPLMKLGAEQEDMTTVVTGIDYDAKTGGKRKTPLPKNKIIISCIARLGPRKGHKYLLDALSRIPSDVLEHVEVLIAGDGEMRSALEEQARKLNLSMVSFLGKRDDVPAILNVTDIFVLPTINDSLPISIIEAMFSGSAIIATDCGGIPDLIRHNKTGLIVEPGNAKVLARALAFFITNKSARKIAASNAKAYAEKYLSSETMIKNIESIYQNTNSSEGDHET